MTPEEEPHSERASEVALLRREMDRDMRERLRAAEARLDALEHQMSHQFHEIVVELRRLAAQQETQGPALDAFNKVLASGMALRWMVVGVVGILATLATAFSAWEAVKKWLP